MLSLLNNVDSAFKCNDIVNFGLLFKIFQNLFEVLSPFVQDKSMSDLICKYLGRSKTFQAELSNRNMNLTSLNGFFVGLSNDMHDTLNKCQPAEPKCCPAINMPLINLSLL